MEETHPINLHSDSGGTGFFQRFLLALMMCIESVEMPEPGAPNMPLFDSRVLQMMVINV